MKTEYLLIKTKKDFCSNKEQFKNLLLSNSRITIEDSTIKLAQDSFTYGLIMQDVTWKNKHEVVFYLTIEAKSSGTEIDNDSICAALERFDIFLQRVNSECGNQFKINTIWDDISIYYAKKLYPQMIEIENLLRKVIYRFMIKIAGSAWFDMTVPKEVKEAIKKTEDKNHLEDAVETEQLYYADFIQLGAFFFQPYTARPFSQDIIKSLKKFVAEKTLNDHISELLETYEAKSNWDRYFAGKIPVDDLYDKWRRLYAFRNNVAHAKKLRKTDYDESVGLIAELSKAFDSCLNHMDDVELTEAESEAVQEVAKETVSESGYTVNWRAKYPGMLSELSTFDVTADHTASAIELGGINWSLWEAADRQQRLINSFGSTGILDENSLYINNQLVSAIDLPTRMSYTPQDTEKLLSADVALNSSMELRAYVLDDLGSYGINQSNIIKATELGTAKDLEQPAKEAKPKGKS